MGRKKIFECSIFAHLRIEKALWEAIPNPKSAFIRNAIEEKLKKAPTGGGGLGGL